MTTPNTAEVKTIANEYASPKKVGDAWGIELTMSANKVAEAELAVGDVVRVTVQTKAKRRWRANHKITDIATPRGSWVDITAVRADDDDFRMVR